MMDLCGMGRGGMAAVLAGALLMAACMPTGGGRYSVYTGSYGAPYGSSGSFGGGGYPAYGYGSGYGGGRDVRDLNNKGRAGLERGCANRYGAGSHKYWQCMDGNRNSDRALRDGCREVFGGSKRRMQSCMSW